MHQNAVIRSLEVIGEAAAKVSVGCRDAHPHLPWREMIGMRHRLIHGYKQVRMEIVWSVVEDQLPALLEPLVPPEEGPDPSHGT